MRPASPVRPRPIVALCVALLGLSACLEADTTGVDDDTSTTESAITIIPDYTVSVSPSEVTMVAGSTVQLAVNTTSIAGSTQSIALSATGLPADIGVSISPITVTAGQSATLTLHAATLALTSFSSIAVTGTSGSKVKSASVMLSVLPQLTQLSNGVPLTVSGDTGSWTYYALTVPDEATNLSFSMSGGTGDADLYVRFGNAATATTYDCRPYKNGNAETCSFATPQIGTYYVAIHAYAAYSGVNFVAQYTLPSPILSNGVPVTFGGDAGSWRAFSIDVPEGATNLSFTLSGGSGDADLYVRFGAAPTLTTYDCRPYRSGNDEVCSYATPQVGTYYVGIAGYLAYSGVTLVAHYTPPPLPSLSNGVPVTNLSGAKDTWSTVFTFTVPAGVQTAAVTISGGSGDADLYVKYGSPPTLTSYDCRPWSNGNDETCSLSKGSGVYYVALYGYAAYSGVTLTGSY